MSGWLDWLEDKINCPFCGEKFTALFCEDGDPERETVVITTLAGGKTTCPHCRNIITDDDINQEKSYFKTK